MVLIGLEDYLAHNNITLKLSPPSLEAGSPGRHGVDLIAAKRIKNKHSPVFAIDVKLHPKKPGKKTDSYKYDPILGCPAIVLSLGDFCTFTREFNNTPLIAWVKSIVIPYLKNSKDIPKFQQWQIYLLKRIADTISHYMIKTDDFLHSDYRPSNNEAHLFPSSQKEFSRFYSNLSLAYMVLKDWCDF